MLARLALANQRDTLSLDRIRASVTRSLGGTAGTHYIVAGLHLAHLALAFPQTLSATQLALLTAPPSWPPKWRRSQPRTLQPRRSWRHSGLRGPGRLFKTPALSHTSKVREDGEHTPVVLRLGLQVEL
jgi:hypothetical protein